jgi:thiol-disulfide isomerase/thioredoxin
VVLFPLNYLRRSPRFPFRKKLAMRTIGQTTGIGERFAILSLCVMLLGNFPSARANDAETLGTRYLTALDLDGRIHRVGDGEGYRALALVFLSNECPVSREYIPELNRLAAEFQNQPVRFLGVISDPTLSRAKALEFQQQFKIQFPVLFDAAGELAAQLKPTHVPECFVLDGAGQLKYRGRIDDLYREVGKKRSPASTHELSDAIAATLAGKEIAVPQTAPVGCPIEAPVASSGNDEVTYNRHIAPLLFAQCVECHRPGEVAPFSLTSYDDAAKRAQYIADVAQNRLMPPWKAEVDHGRFLGERRLTSEEIALLDAWAKAGAPQGDPADLPPVPEFASGWRLGEPDLLVQAPVPFTAPASGEDVFQHFVIPLDIPEDKTVVGFEFRPSNPAIVHHAILFLDNSGVARKKDEETPEPGYQTFGSIGVPVSGIIGVWTPGMTPRFFPEGIGMPIKKGSDLVLQLHIHPSGKEEADQSSVALYFADKPTDRQMAATPFVVGNILIDIPADTSEHTVTSSVVLPTDITLISLLPHMHLIGKEMKITATLPSGEEQSLIWIKDWNFFWQDNYVYHEPVKLPAGTKIDVYSRYDNTEKNPLNPSDPPKRVLFGNGSTDEMCFGIFQIVADQPKGEMKMRGALMQQFMKQWNDSKIAPDARAVIIEEAGKLFGRDISGFNFGGGTRNSRRPQGQNREAAGEDSGN